MENLLAATLVIAGVRRSNNIPWTLMVDPSPQDKQRGNPDGMRSLAKSSQLPIERIRYFPDSTTSLIGEIKRGVLFVMAFCSVPSIKAFSQLTEIIHRLDPYGTLEFVVIDTDGAQTFYEHPDFKEKLHGAGETAWIKDGVIQCTSGLGYNPNCFEPNTKKLLAAN